MKLFTLIVYFQVSGMVANDVWQVLQCLVGLCPIQASLAETSKHHFHSSTEHGAKGVAWYHSCERLSCACIAAKKTKRALDPA